MRFIHFIAIAVAIYYFAVASLRAAADLRLEGLPDLMALTADRMDLMATTVGHLDLMATTADLLPLHIDYTFVTVYIVRFS